MRGENILLVFVCILYRGTPPRAWGKRWMVSRDNCFFRYTPTCVGKTGRVGPPRHRRIGTPPRAWGKLKHLGQPPMILRYTPTCVGKTSWGRTSSSNTRYTPTCVGKTSIARPKNLVSSVHPHVRGENHQKRAKGSLPEGTPPRAWGKLWMLWPARPRARYTPTCVGKTYSPD